MTRLAFICSLIVATAALQVDCRADAEARGSAEPSPAEAGPPRRRLLRQILIAESVEKAQQLTPVPDGAFLMITPPLEAKHLQTLEPRLAAAKGRPIDEPLLASIAQVIEVYFKQNDLPLASAIIPPQNIADGAIRVALLPGKIRNIKFEGNRWFSESLLREKLRIEEGQTLRLSNIERSINWTNASSFRNVRVHLQPIADTGEVDIQVGVTEQAPWRVFASLDNAGNELLGERRMTFGATAGNLWGKDHQITYQHVTTDFSKVFQAHTFEYRAPCPGSTRFHYRAVFCRPILPSSKACSRRRAKA